MGFRYLSMCLMLLVITGCMSTSGKSASENTSFDFDHGVFFEKEDLGENRFHILVRSDKRIQFNRLATFLIRKALQTCQSYGFKLEILEGVEEYDDRIAHPNLIIPSLSANLECPSK